MKSSSLTQYSLDNTGPLTGLEFLVRVLPAACCQKLLVTLERRLVLLQLIENNGAQIVVARNLLAERFDAVERGQRLRVLVGQSEDARQFVPRFLGLGDR